MKYTIATYILMAVLVSFLGFVVEDGWLALTGLYRQPEHASAVFIRLWHCHGRTVPDSRHARHHDFTFSDKEKGNLCPVYYLLRPCNAGSQCRRNHPGNLCGKNLPLLLVGLHGNPSSHYPVHLRSDKPRLCFDHYHLYG